MKNDFGFSLIEILITAGLMGGIALFGASISRNSLIGTKTATALDEARSVTAEMSGVLSSPQACLSSLGGKNPVNGFTVSSIINAAGSPVYVLNGVYGTRTLSLNQISIGGNGVDAKTALNRYTSTGTNTGLALVVVDWLKSASTNGPAHAPRFFFVNVTLDGSGNISACEATGADQNAIWLRNSSDPSKIYYSEGKVGIGTVSPAVSLEVAGPIKSLAVNLGDACPLLGATAFNGSSGAPVYCNSALQWASVGLSKCVLKTSAGGSVSCDAGYTMVGGGCHTTGQSGTPVYYADDYPSSASTWACSFGYNSVASYAVCCQ